MPGRRAIREAPSGSSGAGRCAPHLAVGARRRAVCAITVLTYSSDGIAGVVDLLEGDEELGRVVRHPAAMEQAVKEVGSL
jgi:hypothetical protein